MPVLRADCPSCGVALKIANLALAGKTVKCPKCAKPFTLPQLEDEAEEEAAAVEKPKQSAKRVENEQLPKTSRRAREENEDEVADEIPKSRQSGRNNDEDDERPRKGKADLAKRDEDDRPQRKKKKGTTKKKRSPVLLIGVIAGVFLLVVGVVAFFLLSGPSMRGERETKELVKAMTAAVEEKDAAKKLEAQIKAVEMMAVLEQMKLTEDEQKKLDAKYKGKLDNLRSLADRLGVSPEAQEAQNAQVINPRTQFNAGFPSDKSDNVLAEKPKIDKIFISADGKRVAISNSSHKKKICHVWDIAMGQPKKIMESEGEIAAFSPDGKRLICWRSYRLEIVEAETGKKLGDLQYGGKQIFFRSPDSVVVRTQSKASKVVIRELDCVTGLEIGSFETFADDEYVTMAPPIREGHELFLGMRQTNLIKVWDLSNRTLVRDISLPNSKFREVGNKNEYDNWSQFTVSFDGKYFAMARGSDPVQIFNSGDGTLVAAVPRNFYSSNPVILATREFYLSGSNIARPIKTGNALDIVAFDIKQKKVVAAFRGHEKGWLELAVSANEKVLVVGNEEGNVLIWDLDQLK